MPLLRRIALFLVIIRLAGAASPPASLSHLPLVFEENRGQASAGTRFLARGPGFQIEFQRTSASVLFEGRKIELRYPGATAVAITGLAPTGGQSNYYKGDDSSGWVTGAKHFTKVEYQSIYPDIDLVFYGNQRQIECDWIVHPGADPSRIHLSIDSDAAPALGAAGELTAGDFRLGEPVLYQTVDGRRIPVTGRYRVQGRDVTFVVGAYDSAIDLVIDPTLAVVTYLGGRDVDIPAAVAVDSSGFLYVTGYTASSNFPVTAPVYKNTQTPGDADAFVTKLNPAGSQIIYSTYLGGTFPDYGRAIAVDSSGAAYITGSTIGRFPVTSGAFSIFPANSPAIFAAKLDAAGGTLVYATYIDGAGAGQAIAVDTSGNAYIGGYTYTATLSVSASAAQRLYGGATDGFVVKLNPTGSAELYATFLGGSSEDQITALKVDPAGNVYVSGFTSSTDFPVTAGVVRGVYSGLTDAFAAKLNAAGSALIYSTFLGGANIDRAYALDINASGEAFVAGQTYSTGFPTTAGAFRTVHGGGSSDGFVTRLNATATAFIYSTFLGGAGACTVTDPFRVYTCDTAYGITVTSQNQAYVVGLAGPGFPLAGAPQATAAGNGDAFAALLDGTGATLLFSTYLGGGGSDVALSVVNSNASGPVFVGFTASTDLPVTAGALQAAFAGGSVDGFLARLGTCPASYASGTSSFFPSTAGSYQINITAAAGCSWFVTVDQPWVTLTTSSGTGNGPVTFDLAANNSPARSANISLAGQIYLIQQVAGCFVTLGSSSSWFPQAGVSNLTLQVFSNCTWTVSSTQAWITFSPASATGNGTITYSVASNAGATRSGAIVVNGQTFTINQIGGPGGISTCTFVLSSTFDSYGKDGGSSTILVSTQDGCDWGVFNPNSWIILTGNRAGSGTNVIGYTVERNITGQTRTGVLTFGNQSLTVTEAFN